MKYNIVISGVGGQGILSIATIIATAAMSEGFFVRQSEIHGMSQRGGAVSALVRIADEPIPSDIIPQGKADMILSMEPMESLRYLEFLKDDGKVITAKEPVKNISDYPDIADILKKIDSLPNSVVIDAKELANAAGSARAVNMVLVGAASVYLPLHVEKLEQAVHDIFSRKGEKIVETNIKALRLGKEQGAK